MPSTSRPRLLAFASVLALGLGVAACSDDDGDEGASGSAAEAGDATTTTGSDEGEDLTTTTAPAGASPSSTFVPRDCEIEGEVIVQEGSIPLTDAEASVTSTEGEAGPQALYEVTFPEGTLSLFAPSTGTGFVVLELGEDRFADDGETDLEIRADGTGADVEVDTTDTETAAAGPHVDIRLTCEA